MHIVGEMENTHAPQNPIAAAVCSSSSDSLKPIGEAVCSSSSDSVMSQPDEKSTDVHQAVGTKESNETITTAEESLSPQSSIDNNAASPFTPKASSFMELHISPTFLIEFHVADGALKEDRILYEDFVRNHVNKRLTIQCIHFLYGEEHKATNECQDRIDAIKNCVDVDTGCLDRLRRIAFSEASDRILYQEDSFDRYVLGYSLDNKNVRLSRECGGWVSE